jgi:enterochelin esterase-like enzyme
MEPGRIVVEEIVAEGMARSQPYRVYLPPCYDEWNGKDYPILILIHGLQSTDSQWDDLGVNETADALIRDGELPPMVIVMPWERKGLDFEASVAEVLLPHIRATYAGGDDRTPAAIGGLSRGAGWALRIGLQHPELFQAIGLHSPAVLQPDLFYVPEWVEAARQRSQLPRLWIDIAARDTSRAGAQELADLLEELGLTYAWSSAPGEHSAAYWSARMADYLRWYGEPWKREIEMIGTAPP